MGGGMDERHRRQLIDRGRRILHAFCASAEGQRKLERHRARREKCGENHILSSNQNTPRFIAEWQQGCSGTPKHGRDSEMHEDFVWMAVRSNLMGALAELERTIQNGDALHAASAQNTPARRSRAIAPPHSEPPPVARRRGYALELDRARAELQVERAARKVAEASMSALERRLADASLVGREILSAVGALSAELAIMLGHLAEQENAFEKAMRDASESEQRGHQEGLEVAMEVLEGEITEANAETDRWRKACQAEARRAERAEHEAAGAAGAEQIVRDQLDEAVSKLGAELRAAKEEAERFGTEALGWWDRWEAMAVGVSVKFENTAKRGKIAAEAAAREISRLRSELAAADEKLLHAPSMHTATWEGASRDETKQTGSATVGRDPIFAEFPSPFRRRAVLRIMDEVAAGDGTPRQSSSWTPPPRGAGSGGQAPCASASSLMSFDVSSQGWGSGRLHGRVSCLGGKRLSAGCPPLGEGVAGVPPPRPPRRDTARIRILAGRILDS